MSDVALGGVFKGRCGPTGGGINHKCQKKDQRYGFGGRKKFAESTDAKSSDNLSGFSCEKDEARFTGIGKVGSAMRPGKSKRSGSG